ncbi:hypothetical protein FQR65_LT06486 [Abscondita terminalis]|nr:hypothetical protein FQR65_LT06486 [Abscondita terminalis]
MKFYDPIFGKNLPEFAQSALPAIILTSIIFFTAWSVACAMLTEFTNGFTERVLVLGVNPLHLFIAQAISELLLRVVYLIFIVIYVFLIIKFPLEGSLTVFVFILMLETLCGMSLGFALSSFCDSENGAAYILMGMLVPSTILSGIIWPLEGMPTALRFIGYALPFGIPADGMISVMQKGWGLTYYPIYYSISNILTWTLVLLLITIICTKYRNK